MSKIQDEIKSITYNADKINSSKNYVLTRYRKEWVEKDYGKDVTKCTNCAGKDIPGKGCCHLGCKVGENKKICCVMNEDGYCTICKCPWSNHINSRSHYVEKEVRYTIDDDTLKS
jgi:hypothetical protein